MLLRCLIICQSGKAKIMFNRILKWWFFSNNYLFSVADTRHATRDILPCWSVGRSVSPSVHPLVRPSVCPSIHHIFEFWVVLALLLLPNRPRLSCCVSGLVVFLIVMVALVKNDEEDKEKIIERLHSNPLFNCETPFLGRLFPANHLSVCLLVHPSYHPSLHPSVFLISVSM